MNTLPRHDDGTLMAHVFPGGYPLFYLDHQGSVLCPVCARKSDQDPDELDEFKPEAADVNYEDPDLFCDACSTRIEPAYTD